MHPTGFMQSFLFEVISFGLFYGVYLVAHLIRENQFQVVLIREIILICGESDVKQSCEQASK